MGNDARLQDFLEQPGRAGAFGAIMDECARAAIDLCHVVETIGETEFTEVRESADPNTTSLRAICRHCVNAAYGYSNAIRRARGWEKDLSGRLDDGYPLVPGEFRLQLGHALRHTETTLEGLWELDEKAVMALTFEVPWGPTYDPEMILEHAIVHLLRHRRQIERWIAGI
jgi:hypothetical protein